MTTTNNLIAFEQEYAFRSVELFKTETLGTGSYGAVCKAKCDQLICAAKLIYPVLFQVQTPVTPDSGKEHRQPLQRFEQECHFLSLINHPNIVQYLGTYRDAETNAPVLLMELMDDSLTNFLNSAPEDIPYHTQVNFSYDIAQALAFLHANGIIHRDLSSNNVLLLAGRAKVADFGMSKFAPRLATMTTCPGTPMFMPPEALNEPPVYTEKLDIFSLGVIIIQIITRQYPNPTDSFITRELVDPSFPSQKIKAKVPVPEVQRRESHISLIDEGHPLRATAVECLSDKDVDRPTIQELCSRFALLKEKTQYTESLEHDSDHYLREKSKQVEEKEQLIRVQKAEIEDKSAQIEQLQDKLKNLPSTEEPSAQLRKDLELKEKEILKIQVQLVEKDRQLEVKDLEIRALKDQLADTNRSLVRSEQLCVEVEKKEQDAEKTYQEKTKLFEATIHTLEKNLSHKDAEMKELKRQLAQQATLTSPRKASTLKREYTPLVMDEHKSPSKELKHQPSIEKAICRSLTPPVTPSSTPTGTPAAEKKQYAWKKGVPPAPSVFKAGSVAVHDCTAYFRGAGSSVVYKFDASTGIWETAGSHHLYGFALVMVESTLTTVGGYDKGECSGKLYDLVDSTWTENLPEMPIKRDRPTAVYASGHLIVLGGCNDNSDLLHTVSILEVSTQLWGKATSLPFDLRQASAVVCNDRLYLTTGDSFIDNNAYALLTCSVDNLIQSVKPLSFGARIKKVSAKKLWKVLVNDLPVRQTCLLCVNNELIAAGGTEKSTQSSKNVYKYNSSIRSWEVVKEMSIGRTSCMAAVFKGNLLLVVGGQNTTKEVEAISLPIQT